MSVLSYDRILFEEEQRFRQPWLILVVVFICAIVFTSVFLSLHSLTVASLGTIEFAGMLFGIVASALVVIVLLVARLRVRIDHEALDISFRPFVHRRIRLQEIAQFEPRSYRPLLDASGWGVHYSFSEKGWAYNVSGDRGVQIKLKNGVWLLIGSQKPDELANAIAEGQRDAT
jgi:type IV secretory pathway VirB3-like protein